MRAGRLWHRVTLYDLTETRNSIGEVIASWGNARTRSAAVDMVSARERLTKPAVLEEEVVKFTLRYDSTLSATSKIVHNGLDYFVTGGVRNVEGRDRMLEVLATRRAPT